MHVCYDAGGQNSYQILNFTRGNSRLIYSVTIQQDEICEGHTNFTVQLSLYSGIEPMAIAQSLTEVFTDDCFERECGMVV